MFGHSVFNPMSPQGLAISNLFIFTMVVALVIVLGITGTLVYTAIRFRHRPGEGEPPQQFGIVKLEIAWTVIPFLLIALIFGLTVNTMHLAEPAGDPPPDLTITGHQWWWELHYSSGVVSANEIHIPVGKRFLVALKSADVIHNFWVPQLGPKMDLVPAQTNYLWLEADKAGTYDGECTEFCGGPHAWMLLKVIAQPPAQFAAWEQAQLRPATAPTTSLEKQGAAIFLQNTCQSCHVIYGSGATPITGPGGISHCAGPDARGEQNDAGGGPSCQHRGRHDGVVGPS